MSRTSTTKYFSIHTKIDTQIRFFITMNKSNCIRFSR
nr:MAG TPA: hypothetical protein [Bacteriophage sp.]DAQ87977.1 MAG TPA: hypothetical protein [Caudoviricetes sp.]